MLIELTTWWLKRLQIKRPGPAHCEVSPTKFINNFRLMYRTIEGEMGVAKLYLHVLLAMYCFIAVLRVPSGAELRLLVVHGCILFQSGTE